MDILTSTIAVAANVALLAINTDTVTTWITCICAGLITVGTTVIQLYRLWRDRDKDQNKDDTSGTTDEEEDNTDNSN